MNIGAYALSAVVLFGFVRRLYDGNTALLAAFFYSVVPLSHDYTRTFQIDAFLALFSLLGIDAFWRWTAIALCLLVSAAGGRAILATSHVSSSAVDRVNCARNLSALTAPSALLIIVHPRRVLHGWRPEWLQHRLSPGVFVQQNPVDTGPPSTSSAINPHHTHLAT